MLESLHCRTRWPERNGRLSRPLPEQRAIKLRKAFRSKAFLYISSIPPVCARQKTRLNGWASSALGKRSNARAQYCMCWMPRRTQRLMIRRLQRAQLLEIAGGRTASESVYSARQRHLDALAVAGQHLDAAGHAARDAQALDLFAEELRLAQQQLSSMSGEFTPDDLLGEIFSRFCIGK